MGRDGIELRDIGSFRLSPRRLAGLIAMSAAGKISGKNAKQTLEAVIKEDKDPQTIVTERGWELIADPAKIAETVLTVAAAEAEAGAAARAAAPDDRRRQTLTAFIVGKVLAASGGRADPKIAGQQIEALLRGDQANTPDS